MNPYLLMDFRHLLPPFKCYANFNLEYFVFIMVYTLSILFFFNILNNKVYFLIKQKKKISNTLQVHIIIIGRNLITWKKKYEKLIQELFKPLQKYKNSHETVAPKISLMCFYYLFASNKKKLKALDG